MSTPKLDTNQWYQICWSENPTKQCFVGTWLYNGTAAGKNTRGATFLSPTNSSVPDQLWAILPVSVNSTTVYTLRTKDSGPQGFLASEFVAEETTEGSTRPSMFRGDIATNNVFWTFGGWGDGTFFLTNTANGTDWHMNKKDNGIMAMSPNITAPQNGQRYDFKAVGKIDDARYSSVDVSQAEKKGEVVTHDLLVTWRVVNFSKQRNSFRNSFRIDFGFIYTLSDLCRS
jgi:hypothetical protein